MREKRNKKERKKQMGINKKVELEGRERGRLERGKEAG